MFSGSKFLCFLPKVTQVETGRARNTNPRIQSPCWYPGVLRHLQCANYFSPHCTFFHQEGTQGPQNCPSWGLTCPSGTKRDRSYFHSQLLTKVWNIRQLSRIHPCVLHLFPSETDIFTHPVNGGDRTLTSMLFFLVEGILLLLPELWVSVKSAFVVLCKWWHLTNTTGWFALFYCSYRNMLQRSQTLVMYACLVSAWPATLTGHTRAHGETEWHPAPGTMCLALLLHHLGATTFKEDSKRGFLEKNKVDFCSCYCWKPIQYIQWLETSEKSTQLGTFSFVCGKFSRWTDFLKKTGCSQISEKIVPSRRKSIIRIYILKYNQVFYFQPVEIKHIHLGHIISM